MAIRTVVTRGYGSGSTIGLVATRGYLASTALASVSGSFTEAQIVSGGQQIVITLTGDTFVASGATFDAQRQNIINGLNSAQSETLGWNNEVRDNEVITAVVRTSDTVVTITLTAAASYDITADEGITVTIPATALTGGVEIVGSPIVLVEAFVAASAGGHFMPGLAGIRAGKRRTPKETFEEVAEIVEEVIEEVLEPKTVRVSRKRRSNIIERVASELSDQGVLIGEIQALDRAASLLSNVALKRRREAQKRSEQVDTDEANKQELVAFEASLDAIKADRARRIDEEDAIIMKIINSLIARGF